VTAKGGLMRGHSSAWMFDEWPPKTLRGDMQRLNMANLRLFVVMVYKPIVLPIHKALGRLLTRP